jgi:hypothetical protein
MRTPPHVGITTVEWHRHRAVCRLRSMGRPGTGANRLFRLNVDATIDRTVTFPPAQDGSALLANGTVAVTSTGVIWATALSGTDADYLIRFQPLV